MLRSTLAALAVLVALGSGGAALAAEREIVTLGAPVAVTGPGGVSITTPTSVVFSPPRVEVRSDGRVIVLRQEVPAPQPAPVVQKPAVRQTVIVVREVEVRKLAHRKGHGRKHGGRDSFCRVRHDNGKHLGWYKR